MQQLATIHPSEIRPTRLEAITPDLLNKIDAYWRAANYLSVGQIYRDENPLLEMPLQLSPIKSTTTPFDMTVLNHLDRFHFFGAMIHRLPPLRPRGAHVNQFIQDRLYEHRQYIAKHGEHMPDIRDWKWGGQGKQKVEPQVRV